MVAKLLFFGVLALPALARLQGFHVDDESCSGLVQDNSTAQVAQCARFFASLANLTAAIEHAGLPGAPLTVSVDTGVAWLCPAGATDCINMTWAGASKSVGQHVVDLADEVLLMDYRRDAAAVLAAATPFLRYADESSSSGGGGGGGRDRTVVRVGVAVAAPPAPGGAPPALWQTRDESELLALLAATEPVLAAHRSFGGFAVFTGGNWRAQAAVGPPLARPPAAKSGVWYMDHKVALDLTLRAEWLAWAAERSVDAVYVAPHAGQDALISIPGVEGSPENDKLFCDFIWLAHAQGVDVQLLSSPATDLPFIRNCTGRAP
jgi:hypothetical protein